MFTLRIIFYGLIALFDDGRTEGALALLVRDPSHEASVWMVDGECRTPEGSTKDGCYRFPLSLSPAANEILSQTYERAGFNLTWFLDQEHVAFQPFAGKAWDHPKPLAFQTVPSFPSSDLETRSLVWVPDLTEIAPSAGSLRADCLGVPQPQGCPVAARFEVSRGPISSCHLVHEGDGADAEVHAFEFRPAGAAAASTGSPRALADAVMIEIQVLEPSVRLSSMPFQAASGTPPTSVDLVPQGGQITLIVSNNDYSGEGAHDHFEHYYHLLSGGALTASGNPVPHPRSKQKLSPGACETILDDFETALGVADIDGVHNHRKCDMTQIPSS